LNSSTVNTRSLLRPHRATERQADPPSGDPPLAWPAPLVPSWACASFARPCFVSSPYPLLAPTSPERMCPPPPPFPRPSGLAPGWRSPTPPPSPVCNRPKKHGQHTLNVGGVVHEHAVYHMLLPPVPALT